MTRRALVLLCLALPASASALPSGADGRALRDAADALSELRLEDAERTVTRLAREHPEDPDVRFERGMLRFYQGDYAGAAQDVEAAGDGARLRSPEDRASLRALIVATRDATREFVTARSADGRYVVKHAPGPDAVLVPYAIEAMRAADEALSADLGVRVPGPLRLAIYPSAASLASPAAGSPHYVPTPRKELRRKFSTHDV